MPILSINLLEQQQGKLSRLNQANLVVAIVVGTIVGLQLLVAAFLYSTVAIRNTQKAGLAKETGEYQRKIGDLDSFRQSFYADLSLTQQAKAYQSQVQISEALVNNHKYFSLYMGEIALNTPEAVIYRTISIDGASRLTLAGYARNYPDVSKLAESFKQLTFAKGTTISDAKLEQSADPNARDCPAVNAKQECLGVKFIMLIELKSAGELNKLPSPSKTDRGPAGSPQPSPRPTGSAVPVPGGAE